MMEKSGKNFPTISVRITARDMAFCLILTGSILLNTQVILLELCIWYKTNTFLEPLVDELMEGWERGFKLRSSSSYPFTEKFFVALLCVGCDIFLPVESFVDFWVSVCSHCIRGFLFRSSLVYFHF